MFDFPRNRRFRVQNFRYCSMIVITVRKVNVWELQNPRSQIRIVLDICEGMARIEQYRKFCTRKAGKTPKSNKIENFAHEIIRPRGGAHLPPATWSVRPPAMWHIPPRRRTSAFATWSIRPRGGAQSPPRRGTSPRGDAREQTLPPRLPIILSVRTCAREGWEGRWTRKAVLR